MHYRKSSCVTLECVHCSDEWFMGPWNFWVLWKQKIIRVSRINNIKYRMSCIKSYATWVKVILSSIPPLFYIPMIVYLTLKNSFIIAKIWNTSVIIYLLQFSLEEYYTQKNIIIIYNCPVWPANKKTSRVRSAVMQTDSLAVFVIVSCYLLRMHYMIMSPFCRSLG